MIIHKMVSLLFDTFTGCAPRCSKDQYMTLKHVVLNAAIFRPKETNVILNRVDSPFLTVKKIIGAVGLSEVLPEYAFKVYKNDQSKYFVLTPYLTNSYDQTNSALTCQCSTEHFATNLPFSYPVSLQEELFISQFFSPTMQRAILFIQNHV